MEAMELEDRLLRQKMEEPEKEKQREMEREKLEHEN